MFLQYEYTYNSTLATPTSDWAPVNCAGYDTVALTITSAEGWDGTISFWAGAGTSDVLGEASPALWSLNDAENASLTAQVETVVGATPTAFAKNFRGSVAGLAEFGVYFADPVSSVNAQGIITVSYGFYSSAK
jgi:hypothetical protein